MSLADQLPKTHGFSKLPQGSRKPFDLCLTRTGACYKALCELPLVPGHPCPRLPNFSGKAEVAAPFLKHGAISPNDLIFAMTNEQQSCAGMTSLNGRRFDLVGCLERSHFHARGA